MTVLVLGTQNSGKSALAEKLAVETGDARRYYLATMQVCDAEGRKRVEKHRAAREGKGFVTIEQPSGIREALRAMEDPADATVLLECVSNLVGNELFDHSAGAPMSEEESRTFADGIASDICAFSGKVHHLILVSNTYETEGKDYDDQTLLYIRLLDLVNERLLRMADRVFDLRPGASSKVLPAEKG